MKAGCRSWRGTAVAASLVLAVGTVHAQTFERNTTITGPRGNSVNRQIDITRGPGYIDRNIKITRPGGATFDRNTMIQRGPVAGGPRFYPGRGFGPRIVENNFIVGGGGPGWGTALGIGGGLFGLGLLAGNALATPPPPPPIFVAPPPPVYVAPVPPPGAYPPPVQYAPPAQAAPPPQHGPDPIADAVGRLSSRHDNSRREGCYTLGRIGDPRAVNPLVDRLKNDSNKDVRIAAAWALGEIGDPRSGIYLERSAQYDKKADVREAATRAYGRLPRAAAEMPASTAPRSVAPRRPGTSNPSDPNLPAEPNHLPLPELDSAPSTPPLGPGNPPPPPERPRQGN
jgi:hypothetical protein